MHVVCSDVMSPNQFEAGMDCPLTTAIDGIKLRTHIGPLEPPTQFGEKELG
jgi:hypothetical protein